MSCAVFLCRLRRPPTWSSLRVPLRARPDGRALLGPEALQCRTLLGQMAAQHKVPSSSSRGRAARMVNGLVGVVVYGLVGLGVFVGYRRYAKKQERLAKCQELPRNRYIKADLPLVRYENCVLPRDMILSGTMEEISRFEVRDSDVFVASYPKSGTTWLQEVVYRLSHLRGEEDRYPGEVMETKFPYLEFAYPGIKDLRGRKGRRFIKTHLPRHLVPEALLDERSRAKVLYITRNPKDVCVSYFHFARMLAYIDYAGDLGKFVRQLFIADAAPYSPYFSHLEGYHSMSRSDPSRCLCLRYEDMKEDPKAEIRKVAAFLGVEDLTEEEAESVAAATTFEAMRANPLTNYRHWDDWGLRARGKKGRTDFFRKGQVGDYENHSLERWTRDEFDRWIREGVEATGIAFKYSVSEAKKEEKEKAES